MAETKNQHLSPNEYNSTSWHSWQLYSVAPLGHSHSDPKLTTIWSILIMSRARLGSDMCQFCKLLAWLSWDSNSRPSTWESLRSNWVGHRVQSHVKGNELDSLRLIFKGVQTSLCSPWILKTHCQHFIGHHSYTQQMKSTKRLLREQTTFVSCAQFLNMAFTRDWPFQLCCSQI